MSSTVPSRQSSPSLPPLPVLFGGSAAAQQFRASLEAAAQSDDPILLQGESGSGKDLMARVIHQISAFRNGAFIRLRGSDLEVTHRAIAELGRDEFPWENNLWIYARQAAGGSLMIDEVEDLEPPAQKMLLRVLEGQLDRDEPTRTRFLFATSQDLNERAQTGKMDPDLLFRISTLKLTVPPLRKRREDIPLIMDYLLAQYADQFRSYPPPPSDLFREVLQQYHWPGNIRELANIVRSYVLTHDEHAVLQELQEELTGNRITAEIDVSHPISLKNVTRQVTQDLERQIILKVLRSKGWNRQKTAKWLQMSYRSLLYKLDGIRADAGSPKAQEDAAPLRKVHRDGEHGGYNSDPQSLFRAPRQSA